MKRTRLNFVIDTLAFTGFVVLTTTGVLMRYVLPPGSGHRTAIWSLDRHEWGGIHFWIAVVFFLILALHLVLHWRWIVSVIAGKPREGSGLRAGLGMVGLVTVVALAVSPLLAPVEKTTGGNAIPGLSSHEYEDIRIQGSMTLQEIEETTGVPASHILESLGLPPAIPSGQRLGPLKRQYGFEIDDVRQIIRQYKARK